MKNLIAESVDILMLRQNEVLRLAGLSRRQLFRLRYDGKFPRPVYLAGNRRLMRWKRADVVAWLEANSMASPAPPPIVDRRRRRAAVPTPEPVRA